MIIKNYLGKELTLLNDHDEIRIHTAPGKHESISGRIRTLIVYNNVVIEAGKNKFYAESAIVDFLDKNSPEVIVEKEIEISEAIQDEILEKKLEDFIANKRYWKKKLRDFTGSDLLELEEIIQINEMTKLMLIGSVSKKIIKEKAK